MTAAGQSGLEGARGRARARGRLGSEISHRGKVKGVAAGGNGAGTTKPVPVFVPLLLARGVPHHWADPSADRSALMRGERATLFTTRGGLVRGGEGLRPRAPRCSHD